MNISVFGTGEVDSTVASKFQALGHDVVFGSRHPGADWGGFPGHPRHQTHKVIPANAGIHPEMHQPAVGAETPQDGPRTSLG